MEDSLSNQAQLELIMRRPEEPSSESEYEPREEKQRGSLPRSCQPGEGLLMLLPHCCEMTLVTGSATSESYWLLLLHHPWEQDDKPGSPGNLK